MTDYVLMLIYSLTPLGLVAIMSATNSNISVEYGALGLCGAMVYFLCKHIKHLTKKYEKLIEDNTTAYNRLTNILSGCPCSTDKKDESD